MTKNIILWLFSKVLPKSRPWVEHKTTCSYSSSYGLTIKFYDKYGRYVHMTVDGEDANSVITAVEKIEDMFL